MKLSHSILSIGALASLSILIWWFVVASGAQDPTDNLIWYAGLFGLTFVASFLYPDRPWRWAAAVITPQFLVPFYPTVSNIWPLSVIFLGFVFAALFLVAYCGSAFRDMMNNPQKVKIPRSE